MTQTLYKESFTLSVGKKNVKLGDSSSCLLLISVTSRDSNEIMLNKIVVLLILINIRHVFSDRIYSKVTRA